MSIEMSTWWVCQVWYWNCQLMPKHSEYKNSQRVVRISWVQLCDRWLFKVRNIEVMLTTRQQIIWCANIKDKLFLNLHKKSQNIYSNSAGMIKDSFPLDTCSLLLSIQMSTECLKYKAERKRATKKPSLSRRVEWGKCAHCQLSLFTII